MKSSFPENEMTLTEFQIQLAQGLAPHKRKYSTSSSSSPPSSTEHLLYISMTGPFYQARGHCIVCKESSCTMRCNVCNVWVHKHCWDQHY